MVSALLSALALVLVGHAHAHAPSDLLDSVRARAEGTLDTLSATWISHGGLELVTGGPSAERTQSRWGHVSLRFVGSAPVPLEDLTLEAMALSGPRDHLLTLMAKGAFGGYPIAPLPQTLGQLIRSYYFDETRGYARTIIPSTAASRARLIEVLRTINRERTGHDRYYFFTSNCTSYVSWILSQAGFRQLDPPVPFIPTRASLHLRRSLLSPWPEVEGVSAERLRRLAIEAAQPLEDLTTLDLQRLIVFQSFRLGDRFFAAARALSDRPDLRPTEEVYGVRSLPAEFYEADPAALAAIDPAQISAAFGPEAVAHARRYDRAAWRSTYVTRYCRAAPAQCAYFDRVRELLEASVSTQRAL